MTKSNSNFTALNKSKNRVKEAARLKNQGLTKREIAKEIHVGERQVYRLLNEAEGMEFDFSKDERWSFKESLNESPEQTEFLIRLQAFRGMTKGQAEWAWQISKFPFPEMLIIEFATLLADAEEEWQFKLIGQLLHQPPTGKEKWRNSVDYLLYASSVITDDEWQAKYACFALSKIQGMIQSNYPKLRDIADEQYADHLAGMYMKVFKDEKLRADLLKEMSK